MKIKTKNKFPKPPKIASRILEKLVDEEARYMAMGDFEEQYISTAEKGNLFLARLYYCFQILVILPSSVAYRIQWSGVMINNYFKIALRNFKRQKIYSFINVFGLALGMAACILILLWVRDELSFDRFHKNADNIYHVNVTIGDNIYASAPSPLAHALKEEIPEVLDAVRILIPGTRIIKCGSEVFHENGFTYADPSVFKIFTFPFIAGDPETALEEPYSIVITEKISKNILEKKTR